MEIRLKDIMRNNFRFRIEDKFRLELFREATEKEGTINILAKNFKCHIDTIRIMKNGRTRFIKWQIVKKLIEIVGISKEELESSVLAVKAGKSGRISKVKFPIRESPELALLVAKGLGDGSIEKNFRFSYWNNEKDLINEFCELANKITGKSKVTINELEDGRIQAKCNPFVGLVVHLSGVPIGDKTLQDFNVPYWIKNGSRKIKASFIRGLFDDEAHVQLDKKYKTRRVTIALGKLAKKSKSLENFLISIKKILSEFDINSTEIRKQESIINEDGREKVILCFSISRKENLENFFNKIGFTNPNKSLKLKESLESFNKI